MPTFTICGVREDTAFDVTMTIEADTEANARVKTSLQGIVVIDVVSLEAGGPSNTPKTKPPDERLKPGENIDKGFCPH